MSAMGTAAAVLSAPAALRSPAPQSLFPPGLDGAARSWATIVVAITVQALPFLLLGVLVSAALSALVPARLLRRAAPSNPALAVPVAAGAGVLLPGCECGSVPVARSLIQRGVPPSAALAFLLASPAINPIVLVSTAVAYQGSPGMPIARLAASLLAAVLVGWAWIVLDGDARLALGAKDPGRGEPRACGAREGDDEGPRGLHRHGGAGRLDAFRAAAVHDLLEAGGFLVAGAMVAGLVRVAAPGEWFAALGERPWAAALVMAGLAIVLSLCSEADAFVAASFTGVPATAQLVFLVVGPMVDLKLMAMQYGAFGRRFVARFVPLALSAAILCALAVGPLLPLL